MSLYNGPPRGGARGGKDQFNWESVKSDKDREFYLGHSVKASVGRWQKGKDLFWYAKDKKDDAAAAVRNELAVVKAREEELMMEALGMKPKTVRAKIQPQLDQREMKQLMEKDPEDEEDEAGRTEADRIKGVGFSSGQVRGAGDAGREVMAGVGTARLAGQVSAAGPASTSQRLPAPPQISSADLKHLRKAQKREQKAEKKAKKMARKEGKKAKKSKTEKKKRRKESSASESPSDSAGSASPEPAQKKAKLSHADVHPDREVRSRPSTKDTEDPHRRDAIGAREPAMQQRSRNGSPNKGSHRKHHSRHDSPSQSPPKHQRQAHDTARMHRSRRHDSPEPRMKR